MLGSSGEWQAGERSGRRMEGAVRFAPFHIFYAAYFPRREVAVKQGCAVEHTFHAHDPSRFPRRNIVVESIV